MNARTFLVEDSPVIRENLVDFLQDVADVTVVASAATEKDAIDWLRANADGWDLVLVDLFLAEGNGLVVVQACRERRATQKVVVLSNYATAAMRGRAGQLGADAFFDKSSQLEELVVYCRDLAQRPC